MVIDKDFIITSPVKISGEVVVNANIVVKETGSLHIENATLYFNDDCGIVAEGLVNASNSTFDAKSLTWKKITFKQKSASLSFMKNCVILNGAGIDIEVSTSDITIDNCTFVNCTKEWGGAISSSGESILIKNCKIHDCHAIQTGGAVYMLDGTRIENSIIKNCKARQGAGIQMDLRDNYQYLPMAHNCIIENCESINNGGAINISKNGEVNACEINNCKAKKGGGISIDNSGEIKFCKINNSIAEWAGGGIYCAVISHDKFFIKDSVIYGCTANNEGGGIAINSSGKIFFSGVEIINCNADYGGGMMIGCNTDVQSLGTTQIKHCKSRNRGCSNAVIFKPSDGYSKLNNCLFIDCIDNNDEFLLNLNHEGYYGFAEINNCKAYNYMPNGDIKKYDIKIASRNASHFYINEQRLKDRIDNFVVVKR